MPTAGNTGKTEKQKISSAENQRGIESHKKAAAHLEAAAKYHLEAARHREAGLHEKAAACALTAHGHFILAGEAQRENIKCQVLNY